MEMRKLLGLIWVLVNLQAVVSVQASTQDQVIQDPRKNASLYDLKINRVHSNSIVGNIGDILLKKRLINSTSSIHKYKLIYYSPQLLLSNLFASKPHSLIWIGPDAEALFTVDISNGSIHINSPAGQSILEYLCLSNSYCSCFSCIFTLNFIYETRNKINSETIRLFIDELNEQAPRFHEDTPLVLDIPESSRIGQVFTLSNTAAADSSVYYNKITYYIADILDLSARRDSLLFDVYSTHLDGVKIILKTHLNYEHRQANQLYLMAEDNGEPTALRSSRHLVLNILDDNDHSPVCEKSLFLASLYENSNETNFLQIRAIDLDSNFNSRLEYSLLFVDATDRALFRIDELTGWLSLLKPLDFEKKQFHELFIKVKDNGLKKTLTTNCAVRINVLDLNDNPAKIKMIKHLDESEEANSYVFNSMADEFNQRDQIHVLENNAANKVLALIKVFDSDLLGNYKFLIHSGSYSGSEDTSMFRIQKTDRSEREFELVAARSFDAEQMNTFRIKIVLYDLQSDKFNSPLMGNFFQINLFTTIHVLDMNDNPPTFVEKNYAFSLNENVADIILGPAMQIGDVDVSAHLTELVFRISDPKLSEHLLVKYDNGYISLVVKKAFDFEIQGRLIEFDLITFDAANQTDSTHVTIDLIDQNDNPPLIMNENVTFSIKENGSLNGFIGQVIAIDRDSSGVNSDISFRLIGERDSFAISKNGLITNSVVLDREAKDFYALEIEAFNLFDNQSTLGLFYVKIIDLNDNRPHFIFPNQATEFLMLNLSNSLNNTKLFDVKATDADTGQNGVLTYSIRDSSNLLHINPTNGSVYLDYVNLNMTQQINESLNVSIKITDSGVPCLESHFNFIMFLNWENEGTPPIEVVRMIEQANINCKKIAYTIFS